jgi:hypothetical protein
MGACIKGGILAGIVLFIWSAITWMELPWHKTTMHSFKDEKAVSESIKVNAPLSGIYFLPAKGMEVSEQKYTGPMVFASVRLEGLPTSMGLQMVRGLIGEIIAAIFVGWLLMQAVGLNYFQRVCFVVGFAIAASIVANLGNWNWFAFDTNYTLVLVADVLIGWFLAGLVLAGFCKK